MVTVTSEIVGMNGALGYREFLARLGLSRPGFYKAVREGRLPAPRRIGPGFLIDWSEAYLKRCQLARAAAAQAQKQRQAAKPA